MLNVVFQLFLESVGSLRPVAFVDISGRLVFSEMALLLLTFVVELVLLLGLLLALALLGLQYAARWTTCLGAQVAADMLSMTCVRLLLTDGVVVLGFKS